MKKRRIGFTLVEVALFLAISGLLLVGIIVGTQSSINAQRFRDSVQNYVEFLRSVYSEVENPQHTGDGRSDKALYGRLITFGQEVALNGGDIPKDEQRIYVYDVIGDSNSIGSGNVTAALFSARANVVEKKTKDGNTIVDYVGNVKEYIPTWGAAINTVENGTLYKGSVLIVRHPRSGTISTLVSPTIIDVNKKVKEINNNKNFSEIDQILKKEILDTFVSKEAIFCINPNGINMNGIGIEADIRREVKIIKNARNASGVELFDQDYDNDCSKK